MSYLSSFVYSLNVHDLDFDLLGWVKVKCKCTIRKPISDFLCVGNSNIFYICHRLRAHHVSSTKIVSIRIFDLQKIGHGHEL